MSSLDFIQSPTATCPLCWRKLW